MKETSDISAIAVPLLTAFIGWMLGRITERLKSTDERRRKTRRAICELLELYHRLFTYKFASEKFSERFRKYGVSEFQIRQITTVSLSLDTKISERYELAVSELSESDPFLAFRLRNRQLIEDWLRMTNTLQIGDITTQSLVAQLEKRVLEEFLPSLRAMLEVAADGLGFWEKRKLKNTLLRIEAPSETGDQLLDHIEAGLKQLEDKPANTPSSSAIARP